MSVTRAHAPTLRQSSAVPCGGKGPLRLAGAQRSLVTVSLDLDVGQVFTVENWGLVDFCNTKRPRRRPGPGDHHAGRARGGAAL